MPKKKKLSETRSEAEEARWFEENQERLLKLFEQAEKEGSLRVGGKSVGITLSKKTEALRKPPSQKVMLRIPVDDLDRARSQAARKGVRYQTYIKILLREGLDRQGHLALEVVRGTANGLSTDEILALTRGATRATTRRRK
jgi:predicted DNA binding CopG/RHH family protein